MVDGVKPWRLSGYSFIFLLSIVRGGSTSPRRVGPQGFDRRFSAIARDQFLPGSAPRRNLAVVNWLRSASLVDPASGGGVLTALPCSGPARGCGRPPEVPSL